MLTLYFAPGSCAMAPRFALAYAGADYTLIRMNLGDGEQQRPEHLARNPLGRVPVLVDDDFVLTENLAILRYIARRFPQAALWPDDPKEEARCLELMALCATALHPTMAHERKPQRYAHAPESRIDVVSVARETLASLTMVIERRIAAWEAARDAARTVAQRGIASIDAVERFTVADFYLAFFWLFRPGASYALPASVPITDDDRTPAWTALARRVYALPCIRDICMADGLR